MLEAGRLVGPLQSLLLKLGLLTIAAVVVLWIGWPAEERGSIDAVETDRQELRPSQAGSGQAQVRTTVSTPAPHPAPAGIASAKRLQRHVGQLDRLDLIDLNTATSEQLQGLPGIGETLAQRVIDRREAKGRFQSIDDLLEVKGIGPKRLKQLRPLLTIGSGAARTEARSSQKPL
ncbi:MAG TPA: helix-hairpin-helix domain-containing protein [Nitrospiraceae bacterium]|nr:helix-hairpin-helix domain-containing protein [Nitrospiraceae bacterium]